jgi:hypothetical protein
LILREFCGGRGDELPMKCYRIPPIEQAGVLPESNVDSDFRTEAPHSDGNVVNVVEQCADLPPDPRTMRADCRRAVEPKQPQSPCDGSSMVFNFGPFDVLAK